MQQLGNTSFEVIYKAFNLAFGNYEVQLSKDQLKAMLLRRGFDADLSFAELRDGEIISFILNGIGRFNGVASAYDTGTGTLEEFRGQGLATQIFNYSLPFLKERGICQYVLEVLQHNHGAVSVYRKLGFETSREFNYFIANRAEILCSLKEPSCSCSICKINLRAIMDLNFWDFSPSWQNSFEAIQRAEDCFRVIGAYVDGRIVGYCVFEPESGDITQIAVCPVSRRQGVGSKLFFEAANQMTGDTLKVVNTDIACESITGFLTSKGLSVTGKQFEMAKCL
jgi:ribosomal protein S18 acetylase RimI-like enzyme